jgi:predicted DNA-binding ArsR family transcriptional regulator
MMQAKLINDITDMVWIMRAFDSEVKRDVFEEVCRDWKLAEEIKKDYGKEGTNALKFFEKVKLVETRWRMEEGKARKEYHAFYASFHIKVISSVDMLRDVFSIALMDSEDFARLERKIIKAVGDGELSRGVEKQLSLSPVQMKCVVKRSMKLEYRGMRIEKITG